jgi:hydrogenase small subunit
MALSRRKFLAYCAKSAAALGLAPIDLLLLQEATAAPNMPKVLWLSGSSCTGCSVSLLNRISDVAGEPPSLAELLTDSINLVYHPTLMASAGDDAAALLEHAAQSDEPFILVLEGGVPTAFGGHCCIAYSVGSREVTFQEAVWNLAAKASHIICAGTCSSFGGIPRAGTNPTGVISIAELTGRPTINVSGCPVHPDWIVWTVVQLLLGRDIELDDNGRPFDLYQTDLAGNPAPAIIHEKCPRNGRTEADSFQQAHNNCLIRLGCRGPETKARCEDCWNGIAGQAHWCIGVNAPCHGCTEPTFPGPQPFYEPYGS